MAIWYGVNGSGTIRWSESSLTYDFFGDAGLAQRRRGNQMSLLKRVPKTRSRAPTGRAATDLLTN